MLVEDKRAQHFKPVADVREQIEETLLKEERERLQKQYVEKLRKKTFVRKFEFWDGAISLVWTTKHTKGRTKRSMKVSLLSQLGCSASSATAFDETLPSSQDRSVLPHSCSFSVFRG